MKNTLIFFMITCCLLSCKSYKEIHTLAGTAAEKLDHFKKIEYNYTIGCQDKCYLRALENKTFDLNPPKCNCSEEVKTDRNFNKLLKGLIIYFKALEKLSEDKLTSVNLDPIGDPLVDAQYISKSDLRPLQNLSEHLGQMILNKYRSKHLNSAIEKAHGPVVEILDNLQKLINQNLLLTLENKKGELQQIYLINFKDSLNSNFDRFQIKDEFFKSLSEVDRIKKELNNYTKVLDKVKKGHELLYQNRNSIDLERTKNELIKFYNELDDLLN